MLFLPLPSLPGWEATPGRFGLCTCGALRYGRRLRRAGDTLVYAVVAETPVALDRILSRFAADVATHREAA